MNDLSMMADELLTAALRRGRFVRGGDVSGETYPDAARTYLPDGTGLAWLGPHDLLRCGLFVVDAEVPAPVRPSLARRYGVSDETEFARLWTRAEAWAKLDDVPIVTWLSRHGLDEPLAVTQARSVGEISWKQERFENCILTVAVRRRSVDGQG